MKLYKYTESKLREAIASSTSYREVLLKLNVKAAGGNYSTLRKAIEYFDLDVSHMLGQAHNRGKTIGPKRDIEEYLSNSFPISSHKLRKKLLREGVFEHKCSSCALQDWLNKPIPLELDHMNGNHLDNSLANLRLLCPNCHALTPTYRGKNIGSY
jgi:hypothetical protein